MADLVLLLFIAGFLRGGWSSGFIRRLVGLIFLLVAFVAGAYLRRPAGALVNTFLPKIPPQYAEMVGYTVAFSALLIVLNLLSGLVLSRIARTGLAHRTDQLLGVVLGGVEAVLIISAAIVILHTYTDASRSVSGLGFLHDIRVAVDDSTIGKLLEDTTVPLVLLVLGPLLPKDISSIVPTTIPGGLPGFPGLPFPTVRPS
ncbi:MAG TPA: CvpA family protein [Candidatus Dormibacteraeota bacterium]|nr:CvpA family protein [Candidatus Dormibacteraeota bacterium]